MRNPFFLLLPAHTVQGKEVSDRTLPGHPELCKSFCQCASVPLPHPLFSGILVSQCNGVTHPSGPTKALFLFPLPISALGYGGEIAIVKGPLVKIKITLPNDAAVQPPTALELCQGTVPRT